MYYAHLKMLADFVIVHIGHFIEGTEILGSYMAVQCECQKENLLGDFRDGFFTF